MIDISLGSAPAKGGQLVFLYHTKEGKLIGRDKELFSFYFVIIQQYTLAV